MTRPDDTYTLNAGNSRDLDPHRLQRDAFDVFLEFAGNELPETYQDAVTDARAAMDAAGEHDDLRDAVATAPVRHALDTQALNRDEAYRETVDAYDRITGKFDPGIYGTLQDSGHDYEVRFVDDPELIDDAMDRLMSCWEFVDDAAWLVGVGADVDGYNPTRMEWARDWAEDPHTHFARAYKDGDLAGYTRGFELDNDTGHGVLALDTIEVDKKNFAENTDVIRLQSLAAIQRGLDHDLDWIVSTGEEGRINRGPRQAYGNTERSLHFAKRGQTPRQVHAFDMDHDGRGHATTYLLFENPATVTQ